MAEPPIIDPGSVPASPDMTKVAEWLRAAVRGFFETAYEAEVGASRGIDAMELKAAVDKMTDTALDLLWNDVDKTFAQFLGVVPDFPFDAVAWVFTQVLGLTITGSQIKTLATGSPTSEDRIALGQTLVTMYEETLKTDGVAAGFLAREPGTAEWTNFKSLSGAAIRLQLADMVLKWLGKKVPLGLMDGFRDLADTMNEAIALDDALEEVVQVPMQAVIQKGLEQFYNRQIKGQDYTEVEARNARLADMIDDSILNKVLDNQGVRDDIRDNLMQMAAPNLTESDIDQLYQHNLLDRNQVKDQYRQKYFQEPERELKTKLVEGTRRWKLENQVLELYGNLYRDGVATRLEITPHLEHFGYDNDEIEMWFTTQELERRQRRWLTKSEVQKLVKSGAWTVQYAIDYEVMQGMTAYDASLIMVQEVVEEAKAALPKAVRDECAEILKPQQVLTQLLGELMPILGLPGLADAKLRELIQCLITKLGLP